MSNIEHTGFRDLKMSELHRHFGDDLFMMDLDSVEISKANYSAKALIECKYGFETELKNWQRQAIISMAASRTVELPAFYVNYNDGATQFLVRPLNKTAERKLLYLFTKKSVVDHYYKLPDNSIMMDVLCYRAFIMSIHGVVETKQSPEDIEAIKKHMSPVNPVKMADPVDVKSLLKDFTK